MKNTEIKAHRVGTKAHQKELFRLFREFDEAAARVASRKEEENDFETLVSIVDSMYSSPMQEVTLGLFYLSGKGCKIDVIKAHELFQRAKKHGNELVCLKLSYIYASLEDVDESISCLRRAKWHGSKLAKGMLDYVEKHPFEREIPKA